MWRKTRRRETMVEAAVRAASDYTVRNLNSPYISRKPDGEIRGNLKRRKPEVSYQREAEVEPIPGASSTIHRAASLDRGSRIYS